MTYPYRKVRGPAALTVALLTALITPVVDTGTAEAADAQSMAVSQECGSGRIRAVLRNDTDAATTFHTDWPGIGSWTRQVAAHDRTALYFTRPSGSRYSLHTTTPQGLDSTAAGTLDCAAALSAPVGLDCSRAADGSPTADHRLAVTLVNHSDSARTFTVDWPGTGHWTRTVAAGDSDDSLYWTRQTGAAYRLHITAPGIDHTERGTIDCGLSAGTPGMNSSTILTTDTPIAGLNGQAADGSGHQTYTGTAKSVRIPAMAVTNDGTIIAMADARVDGSYDLGGGTNNIQVAMLRSTDGGASFSSPRIVAHAPTTSEGYGDASLLVDRVTGTVYAFINYSPGPGVGFAGSQPGSNSATDPTAMHLRYMSSTDDGATWSAPVDLNPQVRDPNWAGNFTSSGHGIQLASGRLVQPLVYHDTAGDHAGNIYSDDHGAHWHAGTSAAVDVNESKVIQRGNGKVMQNLRSNAGGNRWYATASDTGGADVASPFGAAWNSGLPDPGCNGDEISYLRPGDVDGGHDPLTTPVALHSNVVGAGRTDLTLRVSTDDGVSWGDQVLLASGAAGYSTMAVLADGSIGDLYEIGDTGGIVFTRFTRDWIARS